MWPLMPFDSDLAESTIGLFKTEAIGDDSPFRDGSLKTIEDVEWRTCPGSIGHDNRRPHSTLGQLPPTEFENNHYAENLSSQPEVTPA